MTDMTSTILNDNVFTFRKDWFYNDGTGGTDYTGHDSDGCYFSVSFSQYGTQVYLSDADQKHSLTVYMPAIETVNQLQFAKLLYLGAANALYFSKRDKLVLVSGMLQNFKRHGLNRIVYHDSVKKMSREFYTAA